MRTSLSFLLILTAVFSSSCGFGESSEQRRSEANTTAGKIGQAAHRVVVQASKATDKAGRDLGKAAHEVKEGWKEDSRKSKGSN